MNFITFSVGTTNIFPMANSTMGGQYATEFNLRSRESVCTPQAVSYMVGPSFVHGESDFKVSYGNLRSQLVISPGRAVVNGHFIENLAEMQIDLAAARATDPSLVGALCIGLRVMYSTLPTMVGTILAEDEDQLYEGIQVVVLPAAEFKLPIDSPDDEYGVTAHIKLADLNYRNGSISGLLNNYPGKCQCIESIRVAGAAESGTDDYLSKAGLNGRNLYVFAGKGEDTDDQGNQYDTWCAAQNSLMIWDAGTRFGYEEHSDAEEAEFVANPLTGTVDLYMPHKQLDYSVTDTHGTPMFYQPKVISLPSANYTTNAPGTVTPEYTKAIKDAFTQLGRYQQLPSGSQITYIDELHELSELPQDPVRYHPGDFVLVGHDYTVVSTDTAAQPPATMYVIQHGLVKSVRYLMSGYNTDAVPEECTGIRLANQTFDADVVSHDPANGAANEMWGINDGAEYHGSSVRHDYLVGTTSRSAGYQTPESPYSVYSDPDIVDENGVLLVDATETNYYLVTSSGINTWTDTIWLTAQIPLATEAAIGGFLNVPDTALDGGYVHLDNEGHLRLIDYSVLRSGTLAYQLSDSISLTGLTMEALQTELDDRVNERIAFPSAAQAYNMAAAGMTPNVIEITLELADDNTADTVYLHGIDSRFNTSIYLHITGNATSNMHLVISDCAKIRIDNNIYGNPTIELYRCGLCYDSEVISSLATISELNLWYEPLTSSSNTNITVDGLTVSVEDPAIIPEEVSFWSVSDPNDNHYEYALRSVTFDNRGNIVGASIMIRNNSTYNVDPGKTLYVSDFRLPQSAELTYPASRLNKPLHITGTFVSAYYSTSDTAYILTTTQFTAVSQTYESVVSGSDVVVQENLGTLSLYANTELVSNVSGQVNDAPFTAGSDIDGWTPDAFHVFSGGIIS